MQYVQDQNLLDSQIVRENVQEPEAVYVNEQDKTEFFVMSKGKIVYHTIQFTREKLNFLKLEPKDQVTIKDVPNYHINGVLLVEIMEKRKLSKFCFTTGRTKFISEFTDTWENPFEEEKDQVDEEVEEAEEEKEIELPKLDKIEGDLPEFDLTGGYSHSDHLCHEWKKMDGTDQKAFRAFMTFIADNRNLLGSLQKFEDRGLLALCLDDNEQMIKALNQIEMNFVTSKPYLKDLTKASTAMSKLPQAAKQEEVYVEILKPTIAGDGVYISPHHGLNIVPLIQNKTTVDHAYINEVVQKRVKDHFIETGKTRAEGFDNIPLVEQMLTGEQMDLFSNFQVISYKNKPHLIGVKLITHGTSAMGGKAEVIRDHPLSKLVQMLTKGLPPQYILIFAYGTDEDFRDKLNIVIQQLRARESDSAKTFDLNLLFKVYVDYMSFLTLDVVPTVKGSSTSLNEGSYNNSVKGLISEINAVNRDLLVDRSTFGRFIKYFSMDVNDAFIHRCVNDLYGEKRDVSITKAFAYIRTGHIIDLDYQSRNPFYEGENVAIDNNDFKWFDTPGNKNKKNDEIYMLDHTNLNLAEHYVSNYEENEAMTDVRLEDKRAKIYLDKTDTADGKAQSAYIADKLLEIQNISENKGYNAWYLGVIVPFISYMQFDDIPKKFVCLAPYPHVASFFVVFTSEENEMYADIVPRALNFKRTSLQLLHLSFMYGVRNFKNLIDKRIDIPNTPIISVWYNKFKVQHNSVKKDFSTFIHKEQVNQKMLSLLQKEKMLIMPIGYDSMVQEKKKQVLSINERMKMLKDLSNE